MNELNVNSCSSDSNFGPTKGFVAIVAAEWAPGWYGPIQILGVGLLCGTAFGLFLRFKLDRRRPLRGLSILQYCSGTRTETLRVLSNYKNPAVLIAQVSRRLMDAGSVDPTRLGRLISAKAVFFFFVLFLSPLRAVRVGVYMPFFNRSAGWRASAICDRRSKY